jgi:hypothetical protein
MPSENPTGSVMTRAMKCPGSCVLPQVRTIGAAPQEMGNVIHAALEHANVNTLKEFSRSTGKPYTREMAIEKMVETFPEHEQTIRGLPYDELKEELEMLPEVAIAYSVKRGGRLLKTKGRDYSKARKDEYCMTIDLVFVGADFVVGFDWKSGLVKLGAPKDSGQLMEAAVCLADIFKKSRAIIGHIYTRPDESVWRDVAELDVFDLQAFHSKMERLDGQLAAARARVKLNQAPDVTMGDHCRYCPATNSCPAQKSLAIELATGKIANYNTSLTRTQMGEAWEKTKILQALLNKVKASIIAEAAREPVLLPDGKVLGQVTKKGNEKLDGDIVYAVLEEMHGQKVASDAVKYSATKTDITKALKTNGVEKHTAVQKSVIETVRERGGAARKPSVKIEEYNAVS